MRLQRHRSRKYKNKSYFKHWIVIPNDIVEKLGWEVGDELHSELRNERLIIKKE